METHCYNEMLLFDCLTNGTLAVKHFFFLFLQFLRKALDNLKSLFAQKLNMFCELTENVQCGLPESWFSRNRLIQYFSSKPFESD